MHWLSAVTSRRCNPAQVAESPKDPTCICICIVPYRKSHPVESRFIVISTFIVGSIIMVNVFFTFVLAVLNVVANFAVGLAFAFIKRIEM